MKHKKRTVAAGSMFGMALVLTFAAAPSAFADGWYGGIGFGQTNVKKELGCSDPYFSGTSCSEDRKDTTLRLFGGTEIIKDVAVEFGYRDLGEAKLSASAGAASATEKLKAKAFDVSAVGTLPVGADFGVTGRVGFARWNIDSTYDETGLPTDSVSKSGIAPVIGVGVKYNLSKTMALHAEWEVLKSLKVEDYKTDIDVLSVSMTFNF